MTQKLDQIILPGDLANYRIAGVTDSSLLLTGLSKFNFFVGANNSGKSRLLRRIAANPSPLGTWSLYPKELREFRHRIFSEIELHGQRHDLLQVKGFLESFEFQSVSTHFGQIKHNLLNSINSLGFGIIDRSLIIHISSIVDKYEDPIQSESSSLLSNALYIPTLRGLRPFSSKTISSNDQNQTDDYYKKRTLDDYFDNQFKWEIYTGLTFYRDLRSLLLGDHSGREMAREFELFLSQELFGGEQITLIPREDSDVVYFKMGDQEERKIHEVGDGLQHLIILTFPLFKNKHIPSQVFIEEPELFLHRGMQRALIKAMSRFEKNQYFIATHSNHLLDLTLDFSDISIYTLQRLPKTPEKSVTQFEITLVSSHDFRVLEELGARSSSVFLSNCTIWVEGITDRRYLAHYLRLYQEYLEWNKDVHETDNGENFTVFSPRQDLHYSFVEYSGGNITHWSFLDQIDDPILVERLCAKAMLVTDKDKGKDKRHQSLKNKLLKRYYCLPCLEVENLLSPEVITLILKGFGEDETQIPVFKHVDYRDQPLGGFLDHLLPEKKRKTTYGEESKSGTGTVKSKLKFSELAIKAMPTREEAATRSDGIPAFKYEQLTPEAQDLAKKMYNFIKASNQF